MADIDIDFRSSFDPKKYFKQATQASTVKNGDLDKHPCGIYFQTIPRDKITGLSAIPYEEAEALGYFKLDCLHLHVLDHFESKKEIRTLLKLEPNWDLLLDPEQVSKLFQVHRHASLLAKVRPRSIQDLADCIALVRPAKRRLLERYLSDKESVRKELYEKTDDGYYYKKSHAISYALTIVLELHLIQLGVL